MVYVNKKEFTKANMFGFGAPNDAFAKYFTGNSYLKFLTDPRECPVFLANVSFEPGCRTNWHKHSATSGGGQMLICAAGEGWYQQEGKEPVSLSEGSFVYIPTEVKHWHGSKADSWFSHISVEVPGENCSNEWLEPVTDDDYNAVNNSQREKTDSVIVTSEKYANQSEFEVANMFGMGLFNEMFAQYFRGRSYLKLITMPQEAPLFLANVTFEPACRNDWHIHHATSGGGQILVCTAGKGWYQEEGKEAQYLKEGSVVYIPAGVKHWHGAVSDSWFSHIAMELPGEDCKTEWCEAVSDENYNSL